jgi:hypothetical protein
MSHICWVPPLAAAATSTPQPLFLLLLLLLLLLLMMMMMMMMMGACTDASRFSWQLRRWPEKFQTKPQLT